MTITFRPPAPAGKPKAALSIRARLLALALIAVVPAMFDRSRLIEANRTERIAAASGETMAFTRQGVDAQQEIVVAVKSVVQLVARVHRMLPGSAEGCERFLAGATSDSSAIKGMSIIGANGRVICSTAMNSVGLDVSDRPYFQQALRTKAFVVGNQAVTRSSGGVGLVAAAPTLDDAGEISGIIAARFELQWIDRIAAEVARRPGAQLLVIDDTDTILAAHPGQDKWHRKRLDDGPLSQALRAQDKGIATVEGLDGVRRIFGFERLPGTNALLAVGLNEADLLLGIDLQMRLSYLRFLIVGVIVLFAVWFGGEHVIVRPLRALARMATHVGHGNLAVRASHHRWAAEFTPLANALDTMAQRLTEREEELRIANERLDRLARQDSLSGLANRRSFDARLEEEWDASARTGAPLALLMIDIDHFKSFNDHYGHVAGDLCLRTVAETLAKSSGGAVVVARYGGEEFALLLGDCDLNRAIGVAELLRAAIEALRLMHAKAPSGHVTASIGVASLRARNGNSAQILIEAADAALYAAKRRSRNTVVGHAPIEQLAPVHT